MMKFSVSLLLALTLAVQAKKEQISQKHPIREDIVEEIKLKATSWTPKAVDENHMRHHSAEDLYRSAGNLGTTKSSVGADVFKTVTHGAYDMFR